MLKIACVTLFAFLLNSCAKVEIKNAEVCGDLGSDGASCFNTLNDDSRDIPKESWDSERFGMLCTSSDNFANWQAAILKLCTAARNRCTFDTKKKIIELREKLDAHNERVYKIHSPQDIKNRSEEVIVLPEIEITDDLIQELENETQYH
jgi:hypothetical protein